MAIAKITRRYPDGQVIELEVGCASSYPDAVAECVYEVARLEGLLETDVDVQDE